MANNLPQQQAAPEAWSTIEPSVRTLLALVAEDAAQAEEDSPEMSSFALLRDALDARESSTPEGLFSCARDERVRLLDQFQSWLLEEHTLLRNKIEVLQGVFERTSPVIRTLSRLYSAGDAVRAYHEVCAQLAEARVNFDLLDRYYEEAIDGEAGELLCSNSPEVLLLWARFDLYKEMQ